MAARAHNFITKMNGPYKIPNLENQGKVVGSTNQPYFYQITSGERHGKSLIYHAQIRKRYSQSPLSLFSKYMKFLKNTKPFAKEKQF